MNKRTKETKGILQEKQCKDPLHLRKDLNLTRESNAYWNSPEMSFLNYDI